MTPAVSPGGRSIVFDRSGELHVLALNEDLTASAEPRRLTESALGAQGAQQPAWSHDCREIFFSKGRQLWRMNVANPEAREQILLAGQDALMPVLSRGQAGTSDRWTYLRSAVDPNIWRLNVPAPGARASSSPILTISSTLVRPECSVFA